ncbi:MAG: hypothetical protein M3160_10300, partial [Candidatus Eremiobacteraeota bacterium]|nr:hypothetical protein [Candidatus Eremiobacteraeota bacterium]
MNAEWISAFAAVATFVVIAATAIAAMVQLRHIRSANQLTGLLHFSEIFESEGFQKAVAFIEQQLLRQLQDPAFVDGLMLPNPDRRAHPELVVCDFLEQQGSYVKFGMIDKEQYIDVTGAFVTSMWQQLREVIAIRRVARSSAAMYENFEYLASLIQNRASQETAAFPHR